MKLIVCASHGPQHGAQDLVFVVGEAPYRESEIFHLSEQILELVLKSKITEIHFEAHPVFALILFHDLLNQNLSMSFGKSYTHLAVESFFEGNLAHLLTEHALDYFECLNGNFESEDLGENFVVISKNKVIEKHGVKGRILKTSDALIYAQKESTVHYPVSTHCKQDLSYLLYRPPLKFVSPVFIRKSFYESLSDQDKIELHKNPNHFFFKNEVTFSATLLKTPGKETYLKDESYFDSSLELIERIL